MTDKQIKALVKEFEQFLIAKERKRTKRPKKAAKPQWRQVRFGHCELCTCQNNRWARRAAPEDVSLCRLCILELQKHGDGFLEMIEEQLMGGQPEKAQELLLDARKL